LNADLSQWNVFRGKDFTGMFYAAPLFNSDLSLWDASAGTNFTYMFQAASAFDHDLCSWGEKWTQSSQADYMFADTACPDTSSPANATGPFCHMCLVL